MGLLLTGTRDQALLAAVVRQAQEVADETGKYVGRTAVQKIMYFLQAVGLPITYRFTIHHYGPFCEDILRDTDWLLADGVLVERSTRHERYSNYGIGSALDELAGMYEDDLKQWNTVIDTTVRALIGLEPTQMEALATLDYVYREQWATSAAPPSRDSVVERFVQLKGNKFPRQQVVELYDVMEHAGFFKT